MHAARSVLELVSRQPEPTIDVLAFREEAMSVVKFIELSGRSSESFEDAVRQTVERASRTIRNIQSVWVKEFEGVVENNQVTQFQLEFPVLVGLGRSERGVEALPGARLPCCRCCTRRLQISWNRDPRPASRRRWADGWARSCCPSRNRHGARSRNSSWAGCWPAVGTSRRRS